MVKAMQKYSKLASRVAQPHQGFTLIEALVSLAIIAVLAAFAAPAFQTAAERMAVSTVADQMVASVNLTRSTAIGNNGNVVVRKLTEAETDRPSGTCGTTQNWSCGWRVFWDQDADGVQDGDANDPANPERTIYNFNITSNVVVMRSANGANMIANRWGQLAGINAVGFAISPKGNSALAASTVVCVNSGSRVRVIERSVACP